LWRSSTATLTKRCVHVWLGQCCSNCDPWQSTRWPKNVNNYLKIIWSSWLHKSDYGNFNYHCFLNSYEAQLHTFYSSRERYEGWMVPVNSG
jgi:hypothetical protein